MPWGVSVLYFLFLASLLYYFFRSMAKPPVQTDAENFFLVAYAAFCGGWGLVLFFKTNSILGILPAWSRSFWKRFGLYLVLSMALKGAIHALPLPDFYIQVMSHSVFIFCLPLLMSLFPGPGFFMNLALKEVESNELTDTKLVLRPRMSKRIFLLSGGIACLAGSVLYLRFTSGEYVSAWFFIIFSALVALGGVSFLMPNGMCLILDQEGFATVILWRRFRFSWSEVADFTVIPTELGERVGWNLSQSDVAGAPRWRKQMARRTWVRQRLGRDAILSDDFGLPATQLCALMTERKATYDRLAGTKPS